MYQNLSNKQEFQKITHKILNISNRGIPRVDFLRKIINLLKDYSKCDSVELLLKEEKMFLTCEVKANKKKSFNYNFTNSQNNNEGIIIPNLSHFTTIDQLKIDILNGNIDLSSPDFNNEGSYWTSNKSDSLTVLHRLSNKKQYSVCYINKHYQSLAIIPIIFDLKIIGILQLVSKSLNFFDKLNISQYERIAEVIGIAFISQRSQSALRERIKELTCLYKISEISEHHEISYKDILQGIVSLLPPAWQYPEITSGRIVLDGEIYATQENPIEKHKQSAEIIIQGEKRGVLEVIYCRKRPELDEGPFLIEERSLINTIAKQIARIVERKELDIERSKLQDQLRHADRLATIGQLAAGVAHELNEPLGNILGFAQLVKKIPEFPEQAVLDIDKIIKASLHAREIIRKLLIFGRESHPEHNKVNLNSIVEDTLSIFETRCKKAGIELLCSLSSDLPEIIGSYSQLNQVLVNLIVNAMQAMPDGGKLKIETNISKNHIVVVVEDNGVGMNEEVKKKIFNPFFTTKDINEGTGLGLAVVHGIVSSHRGIINVDSKTGEGTIFKLEFPISILS